MVKEIPTIKVDEKENKSERIIVVPELPTQPVNKAVDEKGEQITLISVAEALTEIYNDIKLIKKSVA